eukprot:2884242-Rhodomonas_salina.2
MSNPRPTRPSRCARLQFSRCEPLCGLRHPPKKPRPSRSSAKTGDVVIELTVCSDPSLWCTASRPASLSAINDGGKGILSGASAAISACDLHPCAVIIASPILVRTSRVPTTTRAVELPLFSKREDTDWR